MPDSSHPTSPLAAASADDARRAATVHRLPYGVRPPRSVWAEKVVASLKTLAWVAPLTILIWVYAEREQSQPLNNVAIPFEVRINAPNRLVTLKDPTEPVLVCNLIGPRNALDRIRAEITTITAGHPNLQIYVDPKAQSGERELFALAQIYDNPIFAREGVSVKAVSPAYLRIVVDDFQELDLPVTSQADQANVSNVAFDHPTVRVRAPASAFKVAREEGKLFVIADLAQAEGFREQGMHTKVRVPLRPAFTAPNVTLAAPTVLASFDVQQSEVSMELQSVAVAIQMPAVQQGTTIVRVNNNDPFVKNVTIVGPPERMNQLDPTTVRFVLNVTRRTPGSYTEPLTLQAPEGVHVKDDRKYTISYELISRSGE